MGIALLCLLPAQVLWADVHQVAPPGAASRDGVWLSLGALLQAGVVSAGDEIVLRDGNHGEITIKGARFDRPVTIRPAPGAQARLTGLVVDQSQNLIFDGLQVWPDRTGEKGHLIRATPSTQQIIFRNLDLRSRADAADYPRWSRQTWLEVRRSGILLRGTQSAVLTSRFTGVGSGIGVTGEGARIEGNVIRGFSADGIQAPADNATIRGNRIEDCVKVGDNHDDGIQAWSLGPDGKPGRGNLKNLTIENNVILEWRGRAASALVCDLQGIGLFDGTYEGVSITNNLVVVSAYHGISVYGGINGVIANNTVLHRTDAGADRPWIGVFSHKDKRPARRMVVANNIAPKFSLARESIALVDRQNLVERYPARRLQAPYDGDFTPKADGGLVDAAAPKHAPARDILGRPRGDKPDLGAFERP
jgi:hypothetical protein